MAVKKASRKRSVFKAIQWTGDNFVELEDFTGTCLEQTIFNEISFNGKFVKVNDWLVKEEISVAIYDNTIFRRIFDVHD